MASSLMSGPFWSATLQRMVRSAAAAILGSYLVADGVFDVANVDSLAKAASIGGGAAVFTLLFCIAGDAFTGGAGPAFGTVEITSPPAPPIDN